MKKKILALLLSAATLCSLSACGDGNKGKLPLDIAHGIANQTYLYGMCYSLDERMYATNTNYDMKKEVKLMANLGVTSVRIWMHLDSVLLTPTEVNEEYAAKVHALVAELQKYGMQVIGMSHTSFHNGSYRSGKPARDVSEGSYYVTWLDDYYLSWKTAAEEFSDISIFEIDNEMNNADFMCSLGGEKIYSQEEMAEIATDMLYYGSRGILESNPNALTLMGGLTEPSGLGAGTNKSFLQKIYNNIYSGEYGYFYGKEDMSEASLNPDDYFKAACWHPYIGGSDFNRENFVRFNGEIYQVILDNEKKHKKVFFTEIGFSDATFGEEKSARFIEEMYTAVREDMPYVEAVNYFKLLNVATIGWTGSVSRFGLFHDPDVNRIDYALSGNVRNVPGSPKEKAYAYQRVAGGTGSLTLIQSLLDE